MNTNRCKRCNYKTDLVLTETFYELSPNNTLVKVAIPDDAIDFEIIYSAEHDRKYTASRVAGVYNSCDKVDDNTLVVYIPLSQCSLGQGPLHRKLIMNVPNNNFVGQEQQICIPADTKHLLWAGATDINIVIESGIVISTILKGNQGDAFTYADFTPTQIANLKGATGKSAYQFAVDGGYAGTLAQFAKEQADLANNSERLTTVETGKADLVDGLVLQSQIDPMQGRSTGVSTPPQDNEVKWTGDLAAIGTDDFMIEYVGSFDYAGYSYPLVSLGSRIAGSANSLNMINSAYPVNSLSYAAFQKPMSGDSLTNSVYIATNKVKGKQFHVVLGRSGVGAWALVDGIKRSVTHDRVLEIANNLTISNASTFTQLRKFNFADEAFAQSLWNGGRWWEAVVVDQYRGIDSSNGFRYLAPMILSDWTIYGKPAHPPVIQEGAIKISLEKPISSYFGGVFKALGGFSQSKAIRFRFKVKGSSSGLSCTIGLGANSAALSAAATVVTQTTWTEYTYIVVNSYALPLNTFVAYPSYIANIVGEYFLIKDIELTEVGLENEYLPSSLTPTSWRDTAGSSDLLPTNPDKMTLLTESPFTQVLWGAGAPAIAPDFIGQLYLSDTNRVFIAKL